MKIEIDDDTQAMYITLRTDREVTQTIDFDRVRLDMDRGTVVGIEIL